MTMNIQTDFFRSPPLATKLFYSQHQVESIANHINDFDERYPYRKDYSLIIHLDQSINIINSNLEGEENNGYKCQSSLQLRFRYISGQISRYFIDFINQDGEEISDQDIYLKYNIPDSFNFRQSILKNIATDDAWDKSKILLVASTVSSVFFSSRIHCLNEQIHHPKKRKFTELPLNEGFTKIMVYIGLYPFEILGTVCGDNPFRPFVEGETSEIKRRSEFKLLVAIPIEYLEQDPDTRSSTISLWGLDPFYMRPLEDKLKAAIGFNLSIRD